MLQKINKRWCLYNLLRRYLELFSAPVPVNSSLMPQSHSAESVLERARM